MSSLPKASAIKGKVAAINAMAPKDMNAAK